MNNTKLIKSKNNYKTGYNSITEQGEKYPQMLMDFGILKMNQGQIFEECKPMEAAYLLLQGKIEIACGSIKQTINRNNCFDDGPFVLHVPQNTDVKIQSLSDDTEICISRTTNTTDFDIKLYGPDEVIDEYRGKGTMQETSTRIVRTIFDKSNAPWSNLVLGEVIGFPGKWSSYPPHHHPQPEIYYYKLNPENGFAYAENGDDVFKIHNNDISLITEGQTHPHVTAPGYALWYLWVIRHLDDNPYITPIFVDEHVWVTDPDAKFWPEKNK